MEAGTPLWQPTQLPASCFSCHHAGPHFEIFHCHKHLMLHMLLMILVHRWGLMLYLLAGLSAAGMLSQPQCVRLTALAEMQYQ